MQLAKSNCRRHRRRTVYDPGCMCRGVAAGSSGANIGNGEEELSSLVDIAFGPDSAIVPGSNAMDST